MLGSTVSLNGAWSNRGTLTSQGASIAFLNSNYTLASLGSYSRDPEGKDEFVIGGTLNLSGATLDSGAGPGKWVLNNTTIIGGTIDSTIHTTDRNILGRDVSTFQNVTLAGTLLFDSNDGLNIIGSGLTLAGASVHLDNGGSLNFSGTQTLAGSGVSTIIEGSINLSGSSTALTIAPGVISRAARATSITPT